MDKTILLTGGQGFLGWNLTKYFLDKGYKVVCIDKISNVSTPHTIRWINPDSNFYFSYKVDINSKTDVENILNLHKPDYIIHAAAGSAVDTSILHPEMCIHDNVLGTLAILQETLEYYNKLSSNKKDNFRFVHVSTDEIFGELENETDLFTEKNLISPTSPYAISKACSDMFVKSFHRTWNLPIIITNSCNNYGKYQHPEKLIPMIITNALTNKNVTIHGNGKNIRDWINSWDWVNAINTILEKGKIGERYNIGANCEKSNIDIAKFILNYMDEKFIPPTMDDTYSSFIRYGADRPGNDKRYGVDNSKLKNELGWKPTIKFEDGLKETINWYETNELWWQDMVNSAKVW